MLSFRGFGLNAWDVGCSDKNCTGSGLEDILHETRNLNRHFEARCTELRRLCTLRTLKPYNLGMNQGWLNVLHVQGCKPIKHFEPSVVALRTCIVSKTDRSEEALDGAEALDETFLLKGPWVLITQ